MARSTSGSNGLLVANNVNVTTPILLTATQGFNELLGTVANASGTYSGNITVDPSAPFGSVQVRLGNFNAGTLTFGGGTITIPSGVKGLVSRSTITFGGNVLVDSQDTGNVFQIGAPGNAVTLISTGNSTLQTAGFDFSTGLVLGSTGNAVANVHTISGSAVVRVGQNGASTYDLQPSTASASSNILNINGGSLILGQFGMSGLQSSIGSPQTSPQANRCLQWWHCRGWPQLPGHRFGLWTGQPQIHGQRRWRPLGYQPEEWRPVGQTIDFQLLRYGLH